MALSQLFKIRCRQDQISSTEVGLLTPGTDTTCHCGKENQTINHLLACEKLEQPLLLKWGYLPPGIDTTCQCGKENQTISHLLTCEKTGTTCTMDDLLQCNSNAKKKSQRLGATKSSSNGLEEEASNCVFLMGHMLNECCYGKLVFHYINLVFVVVPV